MLTFNLKVLYNDVNLIGVLSITRLRAEGLTSETREPDADNADVGNILCTVTLCGIYAQGVFFCVRRGDRWKQRQES